MQTALLLIVTATIGLLCFPTVQSIFLFPFLNIHKEYYVGKGLPFFGGRFGSSFEQNLGKYPLFHKFGFQTKKSFGFSTPYHGYGISAQQSPPAVVYAAAHKPPPPVVITPHSYAGYKPTFDIVGYGSRPSYSGGLGGLGHYHGGGYEGGGGYGFGTSETVKPHFVTPMGGIGGFNYHGMGHYMRHRHKTITTYISEHESGSAAEAASAGHTYSHILPSLSAFWK